MPKFIDFMNDKQRDPRLNEMLFPSYGEKRCMEIINKYETNEENKKNSKLKVTHFLARKFKYYSFELCIFSVKNSNIRVEKLNFRTKIRLLPQCGTSLWRGNSNISLILLILTVYF